MIEKDCKRLYGRAEISPDSAEAGSRGTWRLRYVPGEIPLGKGDSLVVSTDSDTDWEEPQTARPDEDGFVSVEAPQGVEFVLRIFGVKKFAAEIIRGSVDPGMDLTFVFGKGQGARMQTFAEDRRYFHLDRKSSDGSAVRIPDSPYLRVLGGRAARLVVVNPSTAAPGETLDIIVKAEDVWGNPASAFDEPVTVSLGSEAKTLRLPPDRAVTRVSMKTPSPGVFRVRAECASFSGRGNPILCRTDAAPRLFWGDFHGGQLADAEKIEAYYRYARDVAGLDFVSYQRNDHEMTDRDWEIQKAAEAKYLDPGRFLPLPGYEWSADTRFGGDRNVLFSRPGLPLLRSSYSAVDGQTHSEEGVLPDLPALYAGYRMTDTVLVPHVGGRQALIDLHDGELEPVLEIASTHGTFEWFYLEALKRGYSMGVVAGSDGYTGRPGGEFPGHISRRFSRGGAAAVTAEELTIPCILDSLRGKNCYGTSGPRIYLEFGIDDGKPGEILDVESPPVLHVKVSGTAPIERIDVFRRDKIIHSRKPAGGAYEGGWRVVMTGAASRKSYSGVRWLGRLRSDRAVFHDIRPLRFDSPRSKIVGEGTSIIEWDTTNCGFSHGFEFKFPEPAWFDLSVRNHLYNGMYSSDEIPGTMKISEAPAESAYLEGTLSLNSVTEAGVFASIPLGPIDRTLSIEPVTEGGPEDADLSYTLTEILPGINPYWIRVTQRDLHAAWSSPIFLRRRF